MGRKRSIGRRKRVFIWHLKVLIFGEILALVVNLFLFQTVFNGKVCEDTLTAEQVTVDGSESFRISKCVSKTYAVLSVI